MSQKKKSHTLNNEVYTVTYDKAEHIGATIRTYLKIFGRWFLIPALLFMVMFFIMQPQYLGNFSTAFYLDNGDGLQNVWNIWWVNYAVGDHAMNPYFTTMLHWPYGISLVPQTMNIINGLMAIPLMHIFGFSLVQSVNFAVIFAFVFGGVTMFWFVQKLYKTYWVSLIAGGLFTFSSYHFAHAQGHLQLVSLEFIPLFLLAFWMLVEKVKYRYAFLAAGSLFLVLLCDYYYLFWCVLLGGLWLLWNLLTKKIRITVHVVKVMAVFAAIAGLLVGPLVYALVHLTKVDPLIGSHNAAQFSLDPVSIFLPGGSWFFHALTDWYAKHLEFFAETSVFFGFGLLVLVLVGFIRKFIKKDRTIPRWVNFWWIILISFGILALGPHLHIFGRTIESIPLPYTLLEKLFRLYKYRVCHFVGS